MARATAPSPGRPTPGVVKQDKSSGGSVDTTETRSGPQRVRMGSGERPIGAANGKQTSTMASCQYPPPLPGDRHVAQKAQEMPGAEANFSLGCSRNGGREDPCNLRPPLPRRPSLGHRPPPSPQRPSRANRGLQGGWGVGRSQGSPQRDLRAQEAPEASRACSLSHSLTPWTRPSDLLCYAALRRAPPGAPSTWTMSPSSCRALDPVNCVKYTTIRGCD